MLRRADDYKEQVGRQIERFKEFQGLSAELMKWMDGIETHSGFTVPSSASIQQMKVHFEHVKVNMSLNCIVSRSHPRVLVLSNNKDELKR